MVFDGEALCGILQRYLCSEMQNAPTVLRVLPFIEPEAEWRYRVEHEPACGGVVRVTTLDDVAGEVRCAKCGDTYGDHATDACGAFVPRQVTP